MFWLLPQELRKGRYSKANSSDEEVLQTIVELGLQVEGAAGHAGVVLLPTKTVEQLLVDKRRPELLQPFRLAMLKLASQVRASDYVRQQLKILGFERLS